MNNAPHLINSQLPLTNIAAVTRFQGIYSLCGALVKQQTDGTLYTLLHVCDSHDEVTLHIKGVSPLLSTLQPFDYVQLEARNRFHNGTLFHIAEYVNPIHVIPINTRTINMLPMRGAIVPADCHALVDLVEQIQHPVLQRFVAQVLLQREVSIPFLRNPASKAHHHNTLGGLLRHSIDVANIALQNTTSQSERDIVIVASLLHDIGKVKTLNEHIQLTDVGQLIEHDDITLEICAEPLKQLEKENITIANILRHCWTCASPNARYGYKPQYRIAKYVQQADNLSAHR